MFDIFRWRSKEGPPSSVAEAKELIARVGVSRAGEIFKSEALSGNIFCQIFLSQAAWAIPASERPDHIQKDLEIFTEMAAKSGDAGSQYNFGKIFMNKIDAKASTLNQEGIENIKKAKYWYGMAAAQGLGEAKESLKRLEVFNF